MTLGDVAGVAQPGVGVVVATTAAALLGAAAWLERRGWYPRAAAAGVQAVCAAAIFVWGSAFVLGSADARGAAVLGLTVAAIGWALAFRIRTASAGASEGLSTSGDDEPARKSSRSRKLPTEVWISAAVAAGAAAIGLALAGGGGPAEGESQSARNGASDVVLLACPVMLLVFAAIAFRGHGVATYAMAGLVLMFIATGRLEIEALGDGVAIWGLYAAAPAALVVVLGFALVDWLRRRKTWLVAPERLLEHEELPAAVAWLVIGLAVVAGMIGVLQRDAPLTPFLVAIAAFAVLGAFHNRHQAVVGVLGLLLAAAVLVIALPAWISSDRYALLLGLAIAAAHQLWLAGFWRQQLLEGRAWTTTGWLIGPARRNAQALAVLALVYAMATLGAEAPAAAGSATWPMLSAAALLVLALRFVRDSGADGGDGSALGACLAAGSAVLAMSEGRLSLGPTPAAAAFVLGLAALLVVLRSLAGPPAMRRPIYLAIGAGAAPAGAILALAGGPWGGQVIVAAAMAGAAAAVALRKYDVRVGLASDAV